MSKEKIKQFFLIGFAFFLIMLGYWNYNLDNNKELEVSAEVTNDINIGDVQLVNTEPVEDESNIALVPNDDLNEEKNINEKMENNDNYFEETKIERDRMYSEMIETYKEIIESEKTPEDQKAIAVQEITNITNKKNEIMIAENLIKNKGFENVVILINNDVVNVVVKSSSLSQEQISKIQNIISRELNIEISNINISNKK